MSNANCEVDKLSKSFKGQIIDSNRHITTIVSMGMQFKTITTKEIIVPLSRLILKDYEVEKKRALLWENLGLQPTRTEIQVMTRTTLPSPVNLMK